MDEAQRSEHVGEHRTESTLFKWSLADDSSLRKALHDYQCHFFQRAKTLQHEITTIKHKSSQLNAVIDCIDANINRIANFKFIEQRLEEDYNPFTTAAEQVLDNSACGGEDTLTMLTDAIHQGINDMKNSQNISSACVVPAVIGSSAFYSSISPSESISIKCSTELPTIMSTSSPCTAQTLPVCFDEKTSKMPVFSQIRENELQKHAEMLSPSSFANSCAENGRKSFVGPAVPRHSPPDQLARSPVIFTECNEDGSRSFVNTDTIKSKSTVDINLASEASMPSNADLPYEWLPTIADRRRPNSKIDCSAPAEVNPPFTLKISSSHSSILDNNSDPVEDRSSVHESIFEYTGAEQQKGDVIVEELSCTTKNSSNIDIKETSEKRSIKMHIAKKYPNVFDSDSDDEPLFRNLRSLFNSDSNNICEGVPRNVKSKLSSVSSSGSPKNLAISDNGGYSGTNTKENVESKDEAKASKDQTKYVVDSDAILSMSTDIQSDQINLVTATIWPLSSVIKTRSRGPVRRPSNKFRSSTSTEHDSTNLLSQSISAHCENVSVKENEKEEDRKSQHKNYLKNTSPGMSLLRRVGTPTSMSSNLHVVNRVDTKSAHSFFDSESEDERGDDDLKAIASKSCEAKTTTMVEHPGAACTTFVKENSNNLTMKSKAAFNASEPLMKSFFSKSLFDDDDDNDDLSMFRSKTRKS